VHLVLPGLLGDEALLLTARLDRRIFFMMPWYGQTLLGTTDTDYSGDVNQVQVGEEDVDYLLNEANQVLDGVHWTKKDIIGQFAGLRVLKLVNGAVSNVSRDWELKILETGLLISIGGKLTSARKDAAAIVDTICKNLGIIAPCKTRSRKFPWAPEKNHVEWSASAMIEAEKLGIDQESTLWLLRRHGKRVSGVFRLIEKNRDLANRIVASSPFVLGDLVFCVEYEMVVTLEDLLRRRLPLLITSRLNRDELTHLAGITAEILEWDEVVLEKEIQSCAKKWLRL
jgi:glycerol-3-phosphate dehydrogenase